MSSARVSTDRRIYERSPIVEAVIDIRCVNPSAFSIRELSIVSDKMSVSGYCQSGETVEVVQRMGPDGSSHRTEKKVGLALRKQDDAYVVQAQMLGLTVSRLYPYERWETFRDETKRLWALYAMEARPERLTRVGVRYVNRLEIGSPTIEDLTPFLNLHPVTPWGLSTPPAGYFLQIKQPREQGCMLVVNESAVQHVETGPSAIILDLDSYAEVDTVADESELWNLVEHLHVTVEHAFEASITDKVRDLIR